MKLHSFLVLFIMAAMPAVFAGIGIRHDIAYNGRPGEVRNLLDVYYPENTEVPKDVLVFIHGGSWNSGKKDTYWWLGKNMARKNVVSVIINYSLSPQSQYEQMADDCAAALKWVKDSIAVFGGRADRIFVGERTYPAIKLQSNRLYNTLLKADKPVELKFVKRKKHIGMISQMIFRGNQMYDMILAFMKRY